MKTNNQKHVAAFDQVLGHCNALGQKYNPGSNSINLAALNSLLTSAREKLNAATTAKMNLTKVINARQEAFAQLPAIATRILSMLIASEASPQRIADVKAYRDKLRSPRTGKIAKQEDSTKTIQPTDASRGPISYLDYESRLENFLSIVDLATTDPDYNPNEQEFSSQSLTSFTEQLRSLNISVNQARLVYRIARSNRNEALYGDKGISGTAKRVKKYLQYALGTESEQFRMVNAIRLKSR
jgi:hypothetical protein